MILFVFQLQTTRNSSRRKAAKAGGYIDWDEISDRVQSLRGEILEFVMDLFRVELTAPVFTVQKVTADIPNDAMSGESVKEIRERAAYPTAHRGRDRLNDIKERNRTLRELSSPPLPPVRPKTLLYSPTSPPEKLATSPPSAA